MHVNKESKEKTRVKNASKFSNRFGYSTEGEFFYCRELLAKTTISTIKNSPIKLASTKAVDYEKLTRIFNVVLGSLCHTLNPRKKINFELDPSFSINKEIARGRCYYRKPQERLVYTYFPISPEVIWVDTFSSSLILGTARQMMVFIKRYPEFYTFILSLEKDVQKAVRLKTNRESIKILEKVLSFIEDNYKITGDFFPLQNKEDLLLIKKYIKGSYDVKNYYGYHTNKRLLS